jgi:hypothetical protein
VLFNLYLDYVIIEWQDNNFLQTSILTTLLFADDQVIMTASEGNLQKLLYQLFKTASTYNLTISTAKTKILALKGNELIKAKIMININITEQVTNFNYLGCHLGSNRNYDLQNKLQRFNYLCRTIKLHTA